MRHIVKEKPGSEEFRKKFREIRDDFILKLINYTKTIKISNYRLCNDGKLDKQPYESFDDAKQFIEFMIDQGFRFAFAGVETDHGIEVWLTKWEYPDNGPIWPSKASRLFEEIHEGVYSE